MSRGMQRLPEHIHRRVRELCEGLARAADVQELSREEVSRRSGISLSTITTVFDSSTVNPELRTYIALAGALGIFRCDSRVSRMAPRDLTELRLTEWCARLRAGRALAGLSQGQLADKIGIRQAQLSTWESARTVPRLGSYLLVAEAVDLRV